MWRHDWLRRLGRVLRDAATSRPPIHPGRTWRVETLEPRRLLNATSLVDPGLLVPDPNVGTPVPVEIETLANVAPTGSYHVEDASSDTAVLNALTAAPSDRTSTGTEVLFVDVRVDDLQALVDGARDGVEIVVLDADRDGLEQIAEYLDGRTNLSAIHVVGHGNSGAISLGSSVVTNENLDDYAGLLERIGASLADDGDLLLYGCNVAEGNRGADFVDRLANLTGADVAASTDLTGAAFLGGDWSLETTTGSIDVGLAFDAPTLDAYAGTLDASFSSPAAGDLTLNAFDNTGGTTGVTVTDAGATYVLTLDGGGVWNGGAVAGVVNGGNTLTVTKATFTGDILFDNSGPLVGLTAAVNGGVTFSSASVEFRDMGSFSSDNTIDGAGTNLTVGTTGAGAVNFQGALGSTAALGDVVVNTCTQTGAISFANVGTNAAVGANSLNIGNDATTAINFNGTEYRTVGSQTYNAAAGGNFNVDAGATTTFLNTGTGTFGFDGGGFGNTSIDLVAGSNLVLDTSGGGADEITINGIVGVQDETVTINGARVEIFANVSNIRSLAVTNVSGQVNGTISTSVQATNNFVSFSGAIVAGSAVFTVDTSAGNGDITFGNRIETNGRDLVFNAGTGTVSATNLGVNNNEANDVTVTAATFQLSGGILTQANAGGAGNVQINGNLVLTGNVSVNTTIDNGADTADGTFNVTGTIQGDAANTRSLTINTGDTALDLSGTVIGGGGNTLADLDLTTASLTTGTITLGNSPNALWTTDAINITANVNTSGGTLTIAPRTAATTIGIGGGAGTLNLTDAEIAFLDADFTTITIGDNAAGTGAVDIDAVTFQSHVVAVGGSVTVNGLNVGLNNATLTARTGGIVDGGGGTDVTAFNVFLNAANGIGAAGDIDVSGGGTVNFNATAGAVQITSASGASFSGTSTSNAAVSLTATTGDLVVGANDITTNGGAVTLTVSAADRDIVSVAGSDIVTTGGAAAGAAVTLRADNLDLGGNVNAGNGLVTIRTNDAANQQIRIGGADDATFLGLTDAELDRITTTGGLTIGSNDQNATLQVVAAAGPANAAGTFTLLTGSGTIDIDAVLTAVAGITLTSTTGNLDLGGGGQLSAAGQTLTLTTGGAIVDDEATVDVIALTLNVTAGTGIGAANALETQVANLVFNNTTNQTNITNTGALIVSGASNFGQGGTVAAGSPLTVNAAVTSAADFVLEADGSAADTDDLTINANVTHTGLAGVAKTITLRADDDLILTAGTVSFTNANAGDNLILAADSAAVPTPDANNIGGITQAGASTLTASNITVTSSDAVNLTAGTNDAGTLTATVVDAGEAFSYTDANGFAIGAGDVTTAGGVVSLTAGGADNAITSVAGSNVDTTNGGAVAAGAAVNLTMDNLTLGGAVTAGTGGLVTFRTTNEAAQAIQIGAGAADNAASLGISDAELDNVTTGGGVTIGSATQTANIAFVGAADQATAATITGGTFLVQVGGAATISILGGGVIVNDIATTFDTNTGDIVFSGGSVTTTNDTITFDGNVRLDANAVVNSGAGAGDVLFNGTVNADNSTVSDRALTVNAGTGNVRFVGAVGTGANGQLADLDVTGTLVRFGGDVQVDDNDAPAATATITGNVQLDANVTIDTDKAAGADNSLTITGTVNADDATTNDRTFTVNAGDGSVTFGSTIGAVQALADLDVTAATTNLGGNVTVNDGAAAEVLFDGNVVLDADVTILLDGTNDHSLRVTGTIEDDVAVATRTLIVTAAGGTVTLVGNVGGTRRLQATTITSTAQVDVAGISTIAAIGITGSNIDLNGTTYSSNDGNITFTGPVDLDAGAAITVDSDANNDGTDGNIRFTSTIDGAQTLNLDADTGTVALDGAAGAGTALAALNVTNASQADLASVIAGNIAVTATNIDLNGGTYTATTDDVTFTGAVDLDAAAGALTVTGGGAVGDDVTFTGTVDDTGSNNTLVIVSGAGNTALQGVIGGTAALASLTINAAGTGIIDIAAIGTAGTDGVTGLTALGNATTTRVDFNGTIYRTAGTQSYTAAAGDNLVLTAGNTEFLTAAGTGNDLVFGTANLAIGANTVTVDLTNAAGRGSVGAITGGTGGFTLEGAGAFTIAGNSTYTGTTTVTAGTLLVNGAIDAGNASANTVEVTGTLGGSGTVNNAVNVLANGTLAPGGITNATDVGTLTINGDIDFADNTSRLVVDLFGTGAGQFDVLAFSGNLSLDNARLVTNFDDPATGAVEAPVAGNVYVFLSNTAAGAVTPPFTDEATGLTALADGAQQANFDGTGLAARVHYANIGDGNDGGLIFDGGTFTFTDAAATATQVFVYRNENVLVVSTGTGIAGENIVGETVLDARAITSGTNIVLNLLDLDDRLTVIASRDDGNDPPDTDDILNDYTGTITFNGGTGDDRLIIADTAAGTDVLGLVVHTFTNATDGSIQIDDDGAAGNVPDGGYTINYTSVNDPIQQDIGAESVVLVYTGGADAITVTNAAAAGQTQVATGGTAPTLILDNPVDATTAIATDPRLEIRGMAGDDTITVTSVDAAFRASLVLNGGDGVAGADGNDTVNLNTNLELGSGTSVGNLEIRAETVNLANGGAALTINTDGSDAATAGGSVTIQGDDEATPAVANVELFNMLTIDTEQTNGGDTDNAGNVNLEFTNVSTNVAGLDFVVNTSAINGNGGNVDLGQFSNQGAGNDFLNDLIVSRAGGGAGTNGTVTLHDDVRLDANGADTASFTVNGAGSVVLSPRTDTTVLIDIEQGNDENAGFVALRDATIGADAADVALAINTGFDAGNANRIAGFVRLNGFGNAGGQFVNDVTIDTRGTDGAGTLGAASNGIVLLADNTTGTATTIQLDDGGADAADFVIEGGTGAGSVDVRIVNSLVIDTQNDAAGAAGNVLFGNGSTNTNLSGDGANNDLTIRTSTTGTPGNVILDEVNSAGGGNFLRSLTVNALDTDTPAGPHGTVTLNGDIAVDATAGAASVTIDGNIRLADLAAGATRTIDTSQTAGGIAGGTVALAANGGNVSTAVDGIDLVVDTSDTAGGGNVGLGTFNGSGGNFLNDVTVTTTGGAHGSLTLHGSILLDAFAADTANLVMTSPGDVVVSNTVTVDTENGGDEAAGNVAWSTSNLFADAAGFGLTINTNSAAGNGNVAFGLVDDNAGANAFLESLAINTGATGIVTLNGNVLLDDDGAGAASTGFTANGLVRLPASVRIDTAQNGAEAGGQVQLANGIGGVSATADNVDLVIDTRAANGAVAGAVTLGAFDATGGFRVEDLRVDAGGTGGGTVALNGSILLRDTTGRLSIDAAGSIVDGNAGTMNVTAVDAALQSGGSIGTAANPLETTVGNLEASGTAGVFVVNTGGLIIGGVQNPALPLTGLASTNGNVSVTATGGITVNETVTSGGNTTLVSQGGNLLVSAGVTATGSATLTSAATLGVNAAVVATTGSATLTATNDVNVNAEVRVGTAAAPAGSARIISTAGTIRLAGAVRSFNTAAGSVVVNGPTIVFAGGSLQSGPPSTLVLGAPPAVSILGVSQDTVNGTFTVTVSVGRSGELGHAVLVGFDPVLNPTLAGLVPSQVTRGNVAGGTVLTFVFNVSVDDVNARANPSAPIVFFATAAIDNLDPAARSIQITEGGVDRGQATVRSTAITPLPATAPISERLLADTEVETEAAVVEPLTFVETTTTVVQQATRIETTGTVESTEQGEVYLELRIVLPDGTTKTVTTADGQPLRLPESILEPDNLRRLFANLPVDTYRLVLVDREAGIERTVFQIDLGAPDADPGDYDGEGTNPEEGDESSGTGDEMSALETWPAVAALGPLAIAAVTRFDRGRPERGERIRVRGTRGLRKRRREAEDEAARTRLRTHRAKRRLTTES